MSLPGPSSRATRAVPRASPGLGLWLLCAGCGLLICEPPETGGQRGFGSRSTPRRGEILRAQGPEIGLMATRGVRGWHLVTPPLAAAWLAGDGATSNAGDVEGSHIA